ncbi:hypothetical protein [Streptomyces sp. NRRL S-237]|uniref:hypothetical protein n=1 Tax=Streptomyces sp. NRRL S-237 TaxID=1463895 RepID=UPI00068BE32D|nr:hypothetical protein [Streptomyces sp. NRRL S-237]
MYFDENEPQSVRDQRFAAERAALSEARRTASIDLREAHIGAVIVVVVLVLLGWYGKLVALGVVGGVLLFWFSAALVRAYVDHDRGRHAMRRAYNLTFGWVGWF